jgi:hypothetical protein
VHTGELLREYEHAHIVRWVEFSRDGGRFLTASSDRSAQVWDPRTGQKVGSPMIHENDVVSAHFSVSGNVIMTASLDRTARLWDARSGRPLAEPIFHSAAVTSAQLSLDGSFVATSSADGTTRLWDTTSGLPISEVFSNYSMFPGTLLSPDGRLLLTGTLGACLQLREVWTTKALMPTWLPDLAEAVAGRRLAGRGTTEPVKRERVIEIRGELLGTHDNSHDEYLHWAKWFFADRRTRTISPNSPVTMLDYVQSRIKENTTSSLQEALRLSPTNAPAAARLALKILEQGPMRNPRRAGEADWLSRYALELAPEDPSLIPMRKEIVARIMEIEPP